MPAAKTTSPIYAIFGTDDAEVKRVALELSIKLGGGGDFGVDIIDGQAENSEQAAQRVYQAIEALNTFGFFGGEKLVWLKNANFFADDRTGNSQATVDAIEKLGELLQKDLPAGTKFLISAGGIDKRRSFYKTLSKVAEVQVYERIDSSKQGWEEAGAQLVSAMARQMGLQFQDGALELFTLFTAADRRTVESELEKLMLYAHPRTAINEEDVRLLTPSSRAGVVFELGNALAARQLQRSLDLLEQLLFQGESPVAIMLVTIIPTVRNLLLVKDLMERHKGLRPPSNPFFFGKDLERLGEAAITHLPRTKEGKLNAFSLGFVAVHAKRFKTPELYACLRACLDANVALISAPTEPEVILSQLIVRICAGHK